MSNENIKKEFEELKNAYKDMFDNISIEQFKQIKEKVENERKITAKEMFEKLGYELVNEAPLLYQFNDGGFIKNIEFSISLKSITFSGYEYYNDGRPIDENRIYVDELQAINKQVEELGWKVGSDNNE